jgi:hypothetical protein
VRVIEGFKMKCECRNKGEYCGKSCPEDKNMLCSRDKGHKGKHYACTMIKHKLYTWSD